MKMKTTAHADLRVRKRIGTTNVEKLFSDALQNGVYQKDLKGQLKRFIDKSAITHRSNCVIYKGNIFWFGKGNVLITVIPLHHK